MRATRRSFFRLAGGCGAAAGLAFSHGAAGADKKVTPGTSGGDGGLKIGLASYSLRKLPLEAMLEVCKAADVHYLTIKDMHLPMTDAPEVLKTKVETIKAAGITIAGGGVIYMKANDEAGIRKSFAYAKTCGFPLIVASPAPEALDLVEALVKEHDIRVAIHNHGPEDKMYPAPKDALALVKRRDKRLGVCMDVGHTVRAGADPVRSAIDCGERLFDLHVKDLKDKKAKESQVALGRGLVPLVPLVKALQSMKYQGLVGLEYEIDADNPVPGIRESLGYLRGVLAALSATS